MNAIKPLSISNETVTLSRADWDTLLEELEDARDLDRAHQAKADLATGTSESLPWEMACALLDGANPVRTWRKHRGLSGIELAKRAGINAAYLSEIENDKKPGSAATLKKLATALNVDMGDLIRDPA